jgi:hypothetical protein
MLEGGKLPGFWGIVRAFHSHDTYPSLGFKLLDRLVSKDTFPLLAYRGAHRSAVSLRVWWNREAVWSWEAESGATVRLCYWQRPFSTRNRLMFSEWNILSRACIQSCASRTSPLRNHTQSSLAYIEAYRILYYILFNQDAIPPSFPNGSGVKAKRLWSYSYSVSKISNWI